MVKGSTPFYAVLLASIFLLMPLDEGGSTHLAWTLARLLTLAAVLTALWRTFDRGEVEIPRSFLVVCWAVLVLLLVFGTARAEYTYIATQWTMSYAAMAALFFIAAHVWRSGRYDWIETAILLSGVFEACWGISQYLWGGESRASGTFFNASFYGGYLAAVSAIPLSRIVYSRGGDIFKSFFVPFYGFILLLLSFGIVVSGSRGAVVALIAAFFVVGWSRLGAKIFIACGVLLLLLLAVPNPFQKRLSHLGDTDIYAWSRKDIWRGSIAMIVNNPFGVGPGMYKYYSHRYAFPIENAYARYGKVAEKAHNSYLDLACEMSPLAALTIAGMALFLLFKGVKFARRNKNYRVAGAGGMLAATMCHSLVDSVHKCPPIAFVGVAAAGLIWAVTEDANGFKLRVSGSIRWSLVPIGILSLCMIVLPATAFYINTAGKKMTLDKAGKWLNTVTMLAPNNSSYWYTRSTLEKAKWERDGKKESLENHLLYLEYAAKINPVDSRYPSAIGNLLANMVSSGYGDDKLVDAAISYYDRAIVLSPFNPFYRQRKAELFLNEGSTQSAMEELEKTLETEPNYITARHQLAGILKKEGKTAEAAGQYRILIEKTKIIPDRELSSYEKGLAIMDWKKIKEEAEQLGILTDNGLGIEP